MSSVTYSINGITRGLAENAYASLPEKSRPNKSLYIEKMAYNYKQIAFNSATVGMIAMAVFSALSFSFWPLAPALGVGCWLLRQAVEKDLTESFGGKAVELVTQLGSLDPPHEIKEVVQLVIGGISFPSNWRPVALKVAGITLVRNLIPIN